MISQRKLCFKMNDKRRILILLKILDQIQQGNQDARNGTEKSVATICKEEGISFEQVFYILYITFFIVVLFFIFFIVAFRIENSL